MSSIFSELHTKHTNLLQQMRAAAARDRKRFVADAQELLRDLRLAGRSVGPDQRQRLESYASYWGSFISENTGEYFDTTLEPEAIASTRPTGRDSLTLIYESGREWTIPFLAPERSTEPLVSRDELLNGLKQRLFAGDLALYGPPGIGKTMLAVSLAHDDEVLAQFPDGVLWANFGRSGTTGTLNAWAVALGIPEHEIAAMSTLVDRQRALRAKIGLRRMLLVVDDIREEASALKLGGPNCAHLCTTRSIKAAVSFAPEGLTVVNEMTTTESLALLGKFVPEAVESDPDTARELVTRTGGVPLTLALLGKYLRTSLHGGEPAREFRRLADQWQHGGYNLLPLQDNSALEATTPQSLLLAIGVIEEALDEESRRMFRALSVFPSKPNSFSQEAALAVSEVPATALEALVAYGLLERTGSSRYMIYQPIGDYARAKLIDESVHERMVEFFIGYVEARGGDYDALDSEMPNVQAALETAFKRGMLSRLVQGANAIYRFLEMRGLYPVARTLLTRAREAAESLNDISGLVTILLDEGRLAEKYGDYVRAEEYLDRGLALARQIGDRGKTGDLLFATGVLETSRGDLAQARRRLEEALHLIQSDGDPKRTSEIYSRLGVLARDQGDFDQAERYLGEGLKLARQIPGPDQDLVSDLLLHLGVLKWMRQDPAKAKETLQEGLTLARQIGNRERIAALLHACGLLARTDEDYESAEEFLKQGLTHAQEIGHRWYIGIILIEQGEVYLREQKPDTAVAAFLQALETASEAGTLFIVALALYGLGRVAGFHGDFVEARRQGQASLAILEAIGHVEAKGVRDWLAALPSGGTDDAPMSNDGELGAKR
ncbi:MAG TPA: tetratricopeptide repeat protein [Thermoanaerobaculia bacterium]